MTKISGICISLLSLFAITPALAFDGSTYPYMGVTLGAPLSSVNKISNSSGTVHTVFDPGYMTGLTAGIAFDSTMALDIERIRLEAEISYRSSELKSVKDSLGQTRDVNGTVSVTNFMLNCYFEGPNAISKETPVNLYLTAGAGAAMASVSNIAAVVKSGSNTQFAYQGGMGAAIVLTKNFTLDASYKYLGTTPFKFGTVKATYGSHNALLGLRYSFR